LLSPPNPWEHRVWQGFAPPWCKFFATPLASLAVGYASVLQTTDTLQVVLTAAEVVYALVVVVHNPEVGVAIVLASTPPVAAVADTAEETASGIAVAARQSRKPISVIARFSIVINPTASCLQLGSSIVTSTIIRTARIDEFHQSIPIRIAWQMPTARANSHRRVPVI